MAYRIAFDVGGRFIDFVLFNEETGTTSIEKVPTSGDLTERFFEGVERLGISLNDVDNITHGSTLVVNTIVQEKGARTGLITTQGFRDVYELGRGNRPQIYNLLYQPPAPLVPRYLRFEIPERINHRGEILVPLDEVTARQVVKQLKQEQVEAIAITFLHSYKNPLHEEEMRDIVCEMYPEIMVSISSEITQEWREFERTSTTVLNAYSKNSIARYLGKLEQELSRRTFRGGFSVMQSTGGMTRAENAEVVPLRTLESGPAGGVIGTIHLGNQIGADNLIAADVGGTTFDVSPITNGEPLQKTETKVNERPVLMPSLDILSIGAGGVAASHG